MIGLEVICFVGSIVVDGCINSGIGHLFALLAFKDCIGDLGSDELDSADCVVVAGDNIVNIIGIAVGVNDCNDGDTELAVLPVTAICSLRGSTTNIAAGQFLHVL